MVFISKTRLAAFYEKHERAKDPLLKWYYEVLFSDWSDFADVKNTFNSVDSVGNSRFVFNIGGNKYRIVAMIHFNKRTLYIRFVGTHSEYDKLNSKEI